MKLKCSKNSHEEYGCETKTIIESYDKKPSRKEGILDFLMPIISTPMCIVFRMISLVAIVISVIASFALFYAIYKSYILFTQYNTMPTAEIKSEIMLIAEMAISPFVAFLVSRIGDKLEEYFESYTA